MKHETDESNDPNEPEFSLVETYKILVKIFRLSSVRRLAGVLLTVKVYYQSTNDFMIVLSLLFII